MMWNPGTRGAVENDKSLHAATIASRKPRAHRRISMSEAGQPEWIPHNSRGVAYCLWNYPVTARRALAKSPDVSIPRVEIA